MFFFSFFIFMNFYLQTLEIIYENLSRVKSNQGGFGKVGTHT